MRIRIAFLAATVVIVSASIAGPTAVAATCRRAIVVNDSGDAPVATNGQLRTAIAEVCNGGTIIVEPGLVITLAQGQLVIPAGKSITIKGPATIDANGASRVIWVQIGATLALKNIVVRGGSAAGINNQGTLTLKNGNVTANGRAGVLNTGSVTLIKRARVSGNQGTGVLNDIDSGVFPERVGQLTLKDDSSISENTGVSFGSTGPVGGGIVNLGVTTLNDTSVVKDNVASVGGGIYNADRIADSPTGLVVLNHHSSISGNVATVRGGGVFNDFGVAASARVVLNDSSTVTHNDGAGLSGRGRMILNDFSKVSNNTFGIAGERGVVVLNGSSRVFANEFLGVSVFGTGVTLNDQSSVTGNGGRGIGALEANVILNDESSVTQNQNGGVTVFAGQVIMNGASSIRDNVTAGNGGGIHIESCCAVIMNGSSTIAENRASLGGGIFMLGDPVAPGETPSVSVTLHDSTTITGNVATAGQGGGVYSDGGMVTLNDASSIFANIPDNCYPPGTC